MKGPFAFSEDDLAFIQENKDADVAALLLKWQGEEQKRYLAGQIKARQQVLKKIPSWYQLPQIHFPEGLPLEQASSEATARLKASLISGEYLLDITGGLGVDCHFLSSSFSHCTYVEKEAGLAEVAAYNFKVLGADIEVRNEDGIEALENSTADVVYADPYRRDSHRQKQVRLADCLPDVTQLVPLLSAPGRTSLVKASPMLNISEGLRDLKSVSEVWVISVRNECKELIFVINAYAPDIPRIRSFNLALHGTESFDFVPEKEAPQPRLAEVGNYLYEPNASILKAGAQDALAGELGLGKVHPQSHFFTSQNLSTGFPGKAFAVKSILKAWDKSLKGGRYNVISRNFPEKANRIEQKLRLKPAQSDYLIATKLQNGEYRFIVGTLVEQAD